MFTSWLLYHTSSSIDPFHFQAGGCHMRGFTCNLLFFLVFSTREVNSASWNGQTWQTTKMSNVRKQNQLQKTLKHKNRNNANFSSPWYSLQATCKSNQAATRLPSSTLYGYLSYLLIAVKYSLYASLLRPGTDATDKRQRPTVSKQLNDSLDILLFIW